MRKIVVCLMILVPFMLIAQEETPPPKKVLIHEKLVSKNQYMIVARGYPKPGLTEKIQIRGTAREAAVLNAQILAQERFKESLDVIQKGKAKSFTDSREYSDVTYIITATNIKRYLKPR